MEATIVDRSAALPPSDTMQTDEQHHAVDPNQGAQPIAEGEAKIKKIMLTDKEVGKIKKEVPSLIALSVELFIEAILKQTVENVKSKQSKMISGGHIKEVIMGNNQYDFLQEFVSKIPDLPEPGEEENTPKKPRKRKAADSDADGTHEKHVTVKKSGARRGKKKMNDEDEEYEQPDEMEIPAEAKVKPMEFAPPAGPVVVNFQFAPTEDVPKKIAVDDVDFDAFY